MKKIFAILAIAGFMTACNNSGDKEKSTADTAAVAPDTTSKMAPDTTSKMTPDTTKKADTSAKK